MKIEISEIYMQNFMAYDKKTVMFGKNTSIIGKNGIGKSTIANAYMWLLFDCDYELTHRPKVRREVNGEPVDGEVIVSADFIVDDKKVFLRKVQKRTYSIDGTYKDTNEYNVNCVPKSATDFKNALGVDLEVMKMCCNINAFTSQKSSDMRKFLFGHTEGLSDIEIAAGNRDLKELVQLLANYTTDEISAMNKKIASDMKKESAKYDGKIEEKEHEISLKQNSDIAELELYRNSLKKELEKNREKQKSNNVLLEEYDKATDGLMELKFELNNLVMKHTEECSTTSKRIVEEIDKKNTEIFHLSETIKKNTDGIITSKKEITELSEERGRLSKAWQTVKAEKFDEKIAICPTCHREFPTDEIEIMRSDFENWKTDRIKEIEETGLSIKSQIESLKDAVAKLEVENNDNFQTIEKLQNEVGELENEKPTNELEDTDEYKNLIGQIKEKEKDLAKFNDFTAVKASLADEETIIREKLADCEKSIMAADTSECEKRLEELKAEKLDKEQRRADAEKILYLLEEFEKAKNLLIADGVNANFGLVKWRLFELGKGAGYKSTCVPTVDGKSILSTMSNKGNRILGRIDICNSIQKMSGINCPMWIDDVESLDDENRDKISRMVSSQLVKLMVGNGNELEVRGD